MEPVTHILTGACLARTGLNRRAAYATLTMAVAAEFPDIDTLWGLQGPVAGFQHHRGITHTFVGIPAEAALLVAGVWVLHRWREARARRKVAPLGRGGSAASPPLTAAPVRWGVLYCLALLALLSHLALDYTNNYGLRPFFPFNPHWYAASITFIFDPAMFLLLLAAVVLPPLFRLIGSEVGARKQPFAARGWAVVALLGVCTLWAWRAVEHGRAEQVAQQQTYSQAATPLPQPSDPEGPLPPEAPAVLLSARRVSVSPDPISPFRWYTAIDFGPMYQLGTIDLRAGTYRPAQAVEPKPLPSPLLLAAEQSALGRAYLDWSPMPLMRAAPADREDDLPAGTTVVTFRDPRFLGEMPWLHLARTRAPLTGTVALSSQGKVVGQSMDGKAQR